MGPSHPGPLAGKPKGVFKDFKRLISSKKRKTPVRYHVSRSFCPVIRGPRDHSEILLSYKSYLLQAFPTVLFRTVKTQPLRHHFSVSTTSGISIDNNCYSYTGRNSQLDTLFPGLNSDNPVNTSLPNTSTDS